jgi:hypothetical protein
MGRPAAMTRKRMRAEQIFGSQAHFTKHCFPAICPTIKDNAISTVYFRSLVNCCKDMDEQSTLQMPVFLPYFLSLSSRFGEKMADDAADLGFEEI